MGCYGHWTMKGSHGMGTALGPQEIIYHITGVYCSQYKLYRYRYHHLFVQYKNTFPETKVYFPSQNVEAMAAIVVQAHEQETQGKAETQWERDGGQKEAS